MLTIEPFALELDDPLETATGTIDRREGFLVRYGRGFGEATPLAGWTEPLEATREALKGVQSTLKRGHPSTALLTLAGVPAARHGFVEGLLDHHARTAGVALHRYLGGAATEPDVPVNATIDAHDIEAVVAAGTQARQDGFSAVKLKVGGRTPEADIERIHHLREAIGEDMGVRLDANAAWTIEEARVVFEELAGLDIEYVEDPIDTLDHATTEALQQRVPIALDQPVGTLDPTAVLRHPADVIVIKPMVVGGLDRARSLALAARACRKRVVISDLLGGAIARTGAANLVASMRRPAPAGLATGDRFETDLVETPPPVLNGRFELPSGPGLGLEVES